jgi:L,D-transpeptidase ErfK/SrfK
MISLPRQANVPGCRASSVAVLLSAIMVFVAPVSADTFWMNEGEEGVVGSIQGIVAAHEDTLIDIGRRHNVGFEEMKLANPGVDPWIPGEGTLIVVPSRFILPAAPRKGIVLNVAEMRLYYYPDANRPGPKRVITHPVSIGQVDWQTPLGVTEVASKATDPTWYPPESIRAEHEEMGDPLPLVVPPGPDNPLGKHALNLALRGYLIHGTNKPNGIGMRVSHGCVRMYPEDIATLFDQIPVGTPVHIVDQPIKTGWADGVLFLEVHPSTGELELGGVPEPTDAVRQVVAATTSEQSRLVRWEHVSAVVETVTGIPYAVSKPRVRLKLAKRVQDGLMPVSTPGTRVVLESDDGSDVRLRMTRALGRWPYFLENSRVQ